MKIQMCTADWVAGGGERKHKQRKKEKKRNQNHELIVVMPSCFVHMYEYASTIMYIFCNELDIVNKLVCTRERRRRRRLSDVHSHLQTEIDRFS